eukprot:6635825-Prymnesium_polylepis.1
MHRLRHLQQVEPQPRAAIRRAVSAPRLFCCRQLAQHHVLRSGPSPRVLRLGVVDALRARPPPLARLDEKRNALGRLAVIIALLARTLLPRARVHLPQPLPAVHGHAHGAWDTRCA